MLNAIMVEHLHHLLRRPNDDRLTRLETLRRGIAHIDGKLLSCRERLIKQKSMPFDDL